MFAQQSRKMAPMNVPAGSPRLGAGGGKGGGAASAPATGGKGGGVSAQPSNFNVAPQVADPAMMAAVSQRLQPLPSVQPAVMSQGMQDLMASVGSQFNAPTVMPQPSISPPMVRPMANIPQGLMGQLQGFGGI